MPASTKQSIKNGALDLKVYICKALCRKYEARSQIRARQLVFVGPGAPEIGLTACHFSASHECYTALIYARKAKPALMVERYNQI